MQSTMQSMKTWAQAERPLKAMTKDQLFKYPAADPTDASYWEFSKELIARRAAFDHLVIEADDADRDVVREEYRVRSTLGLVSKYREQLDAAKDEDSGRLATELLRIANSSHRQAEASHQRQVNNAAELRARLQTTAKNETVISAEELQAYFTKQTDAEWKAILEAWMSSTLFKAQGHGWLSFLAVRSKERNVDSDAYWKAEGVARLRGVENSETFQQIRALYQVRVMPTLAARHQFLSDGKADGGLIIASMKPHERAKYWAWAQAYASATLANEWMDDGGVDYNARDINFKTLNLADEDDN